MLLQRSVPRVAQTLRSAPSLGTSLSRPSAHQAFRAAAGQESWRSPLYLALATSSAGGAVALCSSAPARAASTTAANTANVDIVLYQYQVCPFCNKVRAFLDYHDIPYRVVEVEPMRKKELQWSEYKKVPVALVNGEQVNDSSDIISHIAQVTGVKHDTPEEQRAEEAQWREWVDSHLVHLLAPNIYRTVSESLQSFDYITSNSNFSTTEKMFIRYAGAAIMYAVANLVIKRKYKIGDPREDLYAAADQWAGALGDRNYLGGDKPNMADLSVFGVVKSLMGMDTGADVLRNTQIEPWYRRMESQVGDTLASPVPPDAVAHP